MKKLTFLGIFITCIGCQTTSNSDQKLEQIDRNSAREVVLSSKEVGDTIYHVTQQKIWQNNAVVAEKVDTIISVKSWNDTIKVPIYVTIQ